MPGSRRGAAALAVVLSLAATPSSAEKQKRTLPELIALAHVRSTMIAAAQSNVPVREAQKAEVLRLWAPTGDITGALSPSVAIQCIDDKGQPSGLDNGAPNPAYDGNCVRTQNPFSKAPISVPQPSDINGVAGEVALHVIQPVFTFGKIEHGTKAAGKAIEVERARVDAARDETDLLVARAYWGLKTARTARTTAADALDNDLKPWAKKIEGDIDGDNPKFTVNDLQRVRVAIAQGELIVEDLDRTILIAEQGLAGILGEETDIDDAELDAVEIVEHTLAYYQEAAVANRPEVRALNAGVEAMRQLQGVRFAEMLPDLGIVGSISYRAAQNIDKPQNAFLNQPNGGFGFGLVLALRQPLDIFERHAHYLHARADADALLAQRRLALTGIDFEIARAFANLMEARARLGTADRGQHVAQGWLSAVKQNMDLGTADARDLVDAARAYFELRLRYYQAIGDFNVGIAELRRTAGVAVAR